MNNNPSDEARTASGFHSRAATESLLLCTDQLTMENVDFQECYRASDAAAVRFAGKRGREERVGAASRCSSKASGLCSPHASQGCGRPGSKPHPQPGQIRVDSTEIVQASTGGSPDSIRSSSSLVDLLKKSGSYGPEDLPSVPSSPASGSVLPSPCREPIASYLSEQEAQYLRHLNTSEMVHKSKLDLTNVGTSGRRNITPDMRTVLVSWMSEVSQQFQLHQETFFLSVAILDRYLGCHQDVPRASFQMLGACCTLIAAKHEEVMYPSTEQFVAISDHCFTRKQLLACEIDVLETVDHRINVPTSYSMLRMFEAAFWPSAQSGEKFPARHSNSRLVPLAVYLVELAGLDYNMQAYLPSVVAAASLVAAGLILKQSLTTSEITFLESACAPGLADAVSTMLNVHADAGEVALEDVDNPVLAVKEKYASAAWCRVSLI